MDTTLLKLMKNRNLVDGYNTLTILPRRLTRLIRSYVSLTITEKLRVLRLEELTRSSKRFTKLNLLVKERDMMFTLNKLSNTIRSTLNTSLSDMRLISRVLRLDVMEKQHDDLLNEDNDYNKTKGDLYDKNGEEYDTLQKDNQDNFKRIGAFLLRLDRHNITKSRLLRLLVNRKERGLEHLLDHYTNNDLHSNELDKDNDDHNDALLNKDNFNNTTYHIL